MTAKQFKKAIDELGWTQAEAAEELGVRAGRPRINEWMAGRRAVPPYIAAHIGTLTQYWYGEAMKYRKRLEQLEESSSPKPAARKARQPKAKKARKAKS